jgi:hypothetical protein
MFNFKIDVYLVKYFWAKNDVFSDFSAKSCSKPPVFSPFLHISGGLVVLFDFYDPPSTTTPGPGAPPANSWRTKQFWSRPRGL